MKLGEGVKFFVVLVGMFVLLLTAKHGLLARLGMDDSLVGAVILAVICAGLLTTQGWLFVVLAFVLLVAGQSSPATAHALGLQEDHLLALFIGVVFAPWVRQRLE